jgi:hypothetical protein
VCGAEVADDGIRPVQSGGGCIECNGSPACARCGHPRRRHRGAFAGEAARCEARIPVESSLAVGRCGCAGYTTDPSAFGDPTPIVDVVEPRLRLAGEGTVEQPLLAPVHDLLDGGRRLRGLDEFRGVPWRPYD